MIKNKFLKNTSWMIGGSVFQMLISLVVNMMIVRYLGPSDYGLIGYSNSFITFFSSICTLGLNGIIVKELVGNTQKQGEVLGTGIGLRIISSFISIIIIQITINILNPKDNTLLIITFLQSISLIFSSLDLINYWYQSRLESKYSTIIQSVGYIIMSIYKIIILLLGKDVRWFAFSTTLDIMIVSIMIAIAYYKHGGQKLSFNICVGKRLISQSYHFIFARIMVTIYGQIDKLMLGSMMDVKSVGLYSVAITLCGIWSFIPAAFIDSARPIIMNSKDINNEIYIKRLKQLYAVIIWMSIIYALFISCFGEVIINILYGKEYIESLPALKIIVWYCSFSYLGSAKNIWLICEGHSKYEKWFTMYGAIINIILNIIFIPKLGMVGAALTTLMTQILTNVVIPTVYKDTRINTKYIIDAFLLRDIMNKDSIKQVVRSLAN